MGKKTKGIRVYPVDGKLWLSEGTYGKDADGRWLARPPGCSMGSLENHEVEEHEDGTITVTPSILIHVGDGEGGMKEGWHGYLKRGVWEEC